MDPAKLYPIVGVVLIAGFVACMIRGFALTKLADEISPLVWFVIAGFALLFSIYFVGEGTDRYGFLWPIYIGLKYLIASVYLLYIAYVSFCWFLAALGKAKNLKLYGKEGIAVTPGTADSQWDFVGGLLLIFGLAVGFLIWNIVGGLENVYGQVPSMQGGKIDRIVGIAQKIDANRRTLGIEHSELNVSRNPFSIAFHKGVDISDAEQTAYVNKVNAILNPRGYTCTEITRIKYLGPRTSDDQHGYCLITAMCQRGAAPAKKYSFRSKEALGTGGVGGWAEKTFGRKLESLLDATEAALEASPTIARTVLNDALNDIPVGGAMDDLVLVPEP